MTETPFNNLSEKAFRMVAVAAVFLAGWLAYANTLQGEFVWDDVSSVLLHKHVQDPSKFFQLFREDQHAFGRGQGNFYRPLVAVSFMLDYALSAPDSEQVASSPPKVGPFLFHVTNTLWHIAAALLLLALLVRLGAPRFVQMAGPLIYVLHPLHTEAVAYISGRADSMCAASMFAGLWFALWAESPKRRIPGIILSALCFCAALLSKESAFFFPFLLLIFTLIRPSHSGEHKRYAVRLVPFVVALVILIAYSYLRTTVLRFATTSSSAAPFAQRLNETFQAFALYLRLLFVPTGLHMERTLDGVGFGTTLAGAILLIATIGLLVAAIVTKRHRVAMGFAWFVAGWIPVSGLFPLNAPMAEHWMYVPMAGLIWALLELVNEAASRPWAKRAAAIAVYAACLWFGVLTIIRNADWRDNETLFRSTLDRNPRSIRVHYNLAVTYEDILKNLPGARRHYESVIQLYKEKKAASAGQETFWDDEIESHLSLGRIYSQERDFPTAAEHFAAILRINPDERNKPFIAMAALGMGKCYLAAGDVQRATDMFKKAVTIQPELRDEITRLLRGGNPLTG